MGVAYNFRGRFARVIITTPLQEILHLPLGIVLTVRKPVLFWLAFYWYLVITLLDLEVLFMNILNSLIKLESPGQSWIFSDFPGVLEGTTAILLLVPDEVQTLAKH